LHAFNDIQYSMLFLGIVAAGGIFAGTNPSYTPFELAHHIRTSRTKFLITEPEMLPSILAAAGECSIPVSNIWIFDVLKQPIPDGFRSWEALMQHGEKDWVRFDDEEISKRTTATRLYSSGTTGLPKAATLTHHNLISQHTLVHEASWKPHEVRRSRYIDIGLRLSSSPAW
jgi:acyl-CoA synthetase (AMP-forming)/AMP-acid ligase II